MLSLDRKDVITATVGTQALIAGGDAAFPVNNLNIAIDDSIATDAVDLYDAATGRWSISKLPQPRAGGTAVTVGDEVLIAGGWRGDYWRQIPLDSIDVYNANTGSWVTLPQPQPGNYVAAGAVGRKAIFTGLGADGSEVQLFDIDGGRWRTTSVRLGQSGPPKAVAVVGTEALFFCDNGVVTTYDEATGQWVTKTVSPQAYFGGVHAVVGGKVVFAGADYDDADRPANAAGVYDVASGTWSPKTLPNNVGAPTVTTANGKVIIAAGGDAFNPSNAVDIYDATSNTWSTARLSKARYVATAVTIGGRAIFAGGSDDSGSLDRYVDVYDAATGHWSHLKLRQPLQADYSVLALVVGGQVLYVGEKTVDVFSPHRIAEPSTPGIAPGAALRSGNLKLSWAPCAGATNYEVYLDDRRVANVHSSHWNFDRTLPAGSHSWQIVARDPSGRISTAGPRWTFAVGLPSVPAGPEIPSGAVLTSTPTTLSWAPTPGATSYDVFVDGKQIASDLTDNAVAFEDPVPGGQHLWRVRAINRRGATDGPDWTFTTPLPPLTHTTTKLPEPRVGVDPVAVGDKVLFAGGRAAAFSLQAIPDVDVYDLISGSWSFAPPVPSEIDPGSLSGASAGRDAIFTDGTTAGVYDASTASWSLHHLSQSRQGARVVSVGSQVLIIGLGPEGGAEPPDLTAVDVFDSNTGQWSKASLSQTRDGMAVAVVGSQVFFAGGGTESGSGFTPSDVVDIYDATTGQWVAAKLPQPRGSGVAVTVAGRYAVFAGGTEGGAAGNPTRSLDVYDTQTANWSTIALPSGAMDPDSITALGSHVFLANQRDSVVDSYDFVTGLWSHATVPTIGVAGPAVVAGNSVLMTTRGAAINVFDATTDRWTIAALGRAPAGRFRDSVALASGSSAVVVEEDFATDPLTGAPLKDIYVDIFTDTPRLG